MASIQAMLSVSSNAHATSPAPAESHDDDFHAVLASYAPAAQSARDVPRDTRAVKTVKAIERAASPAKVSRKEDHDDDKGASKKAERDSKSSAVSEQDQVVPAPLAQTAPVRTAVALRQQHSNDDHHANVEVVQTAPASTGASKVAAASSFAAATSSKAASSSDVRSSATKPDADPARAEQQKPAVNLLNSDQQKPATTPLPKAIADALVAAVKTPQVPQPNVASDEPVASASAKTQQVQQLKAAPGEPAAFAKAPQVQQPRTLADRPVAGAKASQVEQVKTAADDLVVSAKQQAAEKPAPSAAPQRPQSLVANILTMLNAARGTITATASPKTLVAANTDVKSDAAAGKALATGSTVLQPQIGTTDESQGKQPDERETPHGDAPSKPTISNDDARADAASDKTARDVQPDARDSCSQGPDNTVKAVATPADPVPQTAQSTAPQPAPNANVVVSPILPNAVNVTAASASQRPVSSNFQAADEPDISALATAIAAKSAAGTKTFDIRMDPPELGRVDVHLSVDRDGKVQAMLSAEHPQTLELLQRDSQHLERALKDAGLDLSNNSLNFSLKGEGRQGDGGGAFMARTRSLPDAVVARAEAANASVSNFNYASGDGRLDIRV